MHRKALYELGKRRYDQRRSRSSAVLKGSHEPDEGPGTLVGPWALSSIPEVAPFVFRDQKLCYGTLQGTD
jgi:hypothetical protein